MTSGPPPGHVPDPGPEPAARPGAATAPAPVAGSWRNDLVAGLLAAVLGAAVVLHVRTFPELPDGQPGPALFPGIVSALLVLFGLALVVHAVRGRGGTGTEPDTDAKTGANTDPDGGITAQGRLRALAVVGLVVGYLLLAETLGFAVTMGVLLFLLMWLLGARPLVAAAAAAATTGIVLLLFQQVLLVPLPTGPLG